MAGRVRCVGRGAWRVIAPPFDASLSFRKCDAPPNEAPPPPPSFAWRLWGGPASLYSPPPPGLRGGDHVAGRVRFLELDSMDEGRCWSCATDNSGLPGEGGAGHARNRKEDMRLHGKENSNSHGARPVY